jgi:hypothetical protein
MKNKIQKLKSNPKVQESIKSLKPQKSIWGFLGVVVFFIVPEIVAFIYGMDITAYANDALTHQNGYIKDLYYKALVEVFEGGVSWLNIAIGVALIIWLFKDE